MVPGLIRRQSSVFPESVGTCAPTSEQIIQGIRDAPVYGDTDSMYIRGDQCAVMDLENSLGNLKNEDDVDREKNAKKNKAGGVRILWMISLTVKTYAYVYINSANEVRYKIASKGIPTTTLTFADYMFSAQNLCDIEYRGRVVDIGQSIRGGISKNTSAETFASVHSVHLQRTFDKTSMTARIALNDSFEMDPGGHITVPKGHIFAPLPELVDESSPADNVEDNIMDSLSEDNETDSQEDFLQFQMDELDKDVVDNSMRTQRDDMYLDAQYGLHNFTEFG